MSKAETHIPVHRPVGGARSPLHHIPVRADTGAKPGPAPEGAGVTLREQPCLGHLNLRGDPLDGAFLQAAQGVLGKPLPRRPCGSVETESLLALWLAPDEWLLVVEGGREAELEAKLRGAIEVHFSVVDISGGQTLLELSGAEAVNVMKKSTAYDMHIDAFPVGKTVSTTFAKTGVVIRRRRRDCFQLVVRRSFADYVWQWLRCAGEEYGILC